MSLTFDPYEELIHTIVQLTRFAVDFLRVTFTGLSQFLSGSEQLFGICDGVLSTKNYHPTLRNNFMTAH
jgi:hypothetical protein